MGTRFPPEFVEEVRAQASIVAVVSTYVSLRQMGQSHKGLCPFHQEKTPSFNVSDSRGYFHCFGCGAGGDVFKFLMLHDKLSFPDSVVRVAEIHGIQVPEMGERPRDDRRQRLLAVNERALALYRAGLTGPAGQTARAYLEKRGFGPDSWQRFELGLSPGGWDVVSRGLVGSGHNQEDIIAVGLATPRPGGNGIYDRFRERIVFPIRAVGGQLVGFGGRALGNQEPKYLNSPETELYQKGEVVYGLHFARDQARRSGHVVLVEGYMDVLQLHLAGVEEAVASLGTSLTEGQARLLARYVPRVDIAYDGDQAGRRATAKALMTLRAHRLEVAVIELGDGEDPDDLVRNGGPDAFHERRAAAIGPVPFLVRAACREEPGITRTPEGRLRLVNRVLPVVVMAQDPVERALQAAALAEAAGIEDRVLLTAIERAARERQNKIEREDVPSKKGDRWSEAEAVLVLALLGGEDGWLALGPHLDLLDLDELVAGSVIRALVASWERGAPPAAGAIAEGLDDAGRELLGRIAVGGREVTPIAAQWALTSLRGDRLRREIRAIQRRIALARGAELDQLLAEKQELSRSLDALQ